ncbi:hypothetical protein ACGC1H_006644 [Rhizoctonia solani]
MESMFGKFPLANRPKMTRRKRKNLNLTPGASTSGPQRGGNSPTTEPMNDSVDTTPRISYLALQSSTATTGGVGPARRTRGVRQTRRLKRGGDPYNNWVISNDTLSSPTTEEALPVTPRSDMSSTFSISPSPRPAFGRPDSPIYERRNAVSAGPHSASYGFLSSTEFDGFAPASTPLIPTHTWLMSTGEVSQRFPEPILPGLVQTRSEGALNPHNQAFLNQPSSSIGYNPSALGVPQAQIAVPYDPNPPSNLSSYATSNYQDIRSFNQSSSRIGSFLAEQTLPWQDFSPAYPSGTMTEHHSLNPNNTFSSGPPTAASGLSGMSYTTYDGPYSGVNGTNQVHFFSPPHAYAPPPMVDLNTESHLQSISPDTRMPSLASLAFNRTGSTQ